MQNAVLPYFLDYSGHSFQTTVFRMLEDYTLSSCSVCSERALVMAEREKIAALVSYIQETFDLETLYDKLLGVSDADYIEEEVVIPSIPTETSTSPRLSASPRGVDSSAVDDAIVSRMSSILNTDQLSALRSFVFICLVVL